MRSVLITGVTGQDGAYLAKILLENECEVYGVIRDKKVIYDYNLISLGIKNKVKLIEMDLIDKSDFADLLHEKKISEVYHLAAQSSVGASFKDPYKTIKDNFNLTVNLLDQVRLTNKKVKFYNSVSSEIFGNQENLPINERSSINPVSPYGLSKAFSYQMGQYYRTVFGMFICHGILFNHESELRRGDFFINKIINGCIQVKHGLQDKIVVGNLNIKRDFGYAPKYVEAIYMMMQQNAPDDYIVCSGESLYLGQILAYILKKFNLPEDIVEINPDLLRKDEIFEIYGDNQKIKTIGWKYDLSFFEVLDIIILKKIAAKI